jgi:hypothetical protein
MKGFVCAFALTVALTGSAAAQSKEELKETTATILNLNGLLCAKVVEIRPLEMANQYEVTCIEYRGGSGTVRYILNAATARRSKRAKTSGSLGRGCAMGHRGDCYPAITPLVGKPRSTTLAGASSIS